MYCVLTCVPPWGKICDKILRNISRFEEYILLWKYRLKLWQHYKKQTVLVSQLAWQILFKYLTELALLRPSNYFTINRIKNATNAVCRHTIHVTLIRSNLHDFYTFSQIHVLFAESWCNLFELFGQTCDKIVCYQYSASFYIPLGFDTGLIVAWWLILEVRVLLFTWLINMYQGVKFDLINVSCIVWRHTAFVAFFILLIVK
jgi:hypothetical protein